MRFMCLHPEGRILELPTNATPVDFAYAVHTDIGNSCVGARVERQPFPLSRPLTSGQTVEIITAPGARPNAAWLNFVVTSRARKIRQFLKKPACGRVDHSGAPSAQPLAGRQRKLKTCQQKICVRYYTTPAMTR